MSGMHIAKHTRPVLHNVYIVEDVGGCLETGGRLAPLLTANLDMLGAQAQRLICCRFNAQYAVLSSETVNTDCK